MARTNSNSRKQREKYEDYINDNQVRESLMGHLPDEFDEGLALNYHDDEEESSGHATIKVDNEIEYAVKELLQNSSRLDGKDITVSSDKTNVTLSGTVKSQEERDYALSLVKLVHGIGEIQSELIVKRNEGILPTDIGRHD